MAESDPYLVLGIEADASDDEVRAAFRRAVRAEHPDTSLEDGTGVRRVIDAYRLLADPEARVRYDTARARQERRIEVSGDPTPVRRVSMMCRSCDGRGVVRVVEVCPECRGHPEVTALDESGARVWRCSRCRGIGQLASRGRCARCLGSGSVNAG